MLTSRSERVNKTVVWTAQLLATLIMGQTLFFKFSASEESVYIFSKIGLEPAGRNGTGMLELIACILLLVPSVAWLGALLGLGLMSGAIFFHFTSIGFEVMDDGGYLFILAIIVWLCCLEVLWLRRKQLPFLQRKFQ